MLARCSTAYGRERAVLAGVWLLLLWCALQSPVAVQSVYPSCGYAYDLSVPPLPRTRVPRPALAHLNGSAFDPYGCSFTFEQYVEAHSDWAPCFHSPVVNVHTCPSGCLQAALPSFDARAAVIGSGPYHHSSSICLAAIHAGAISEQQGGAVHVDRFYPVDWSGGDTQTVWPEQSALGSVSHGVTSEAVPADEVVRPAPLSSNSWAVRRRGAGPRQVQLAPFAPRSGHVHAVLWPELQLRANWSLGGLNNGWLLGETMLSHNYSLHFIIGGRNDTHYLNVGHTAHSTRRDRAEQDWAS